MFSTLDQVKAWVAAGGGPVPHVAVDGEVGWIADEINRLETELPTLRQAAKDAQAEESRQREDYNKAANAFYRVMEERRASVEFAVLGVRAAEAAAELAADPDNEELAAKAVAARQAQEAYLCAGQPTAPASSYDQYWAVEQAHEQLRTMRAILEDIVEDDPGITAAADQARALFEQYARLDAQLSAVAETFHTVGKRIDRDRDRRYPGLSSLANSWLTTLEATANPDQDPRGCYLQHSEVVLNRLETLEMQDR